MNTWFVVLIIAALIFFVLHRLYRRALRRSVFRNIGEIQKLLASLEAQAVSSDVKNKAKQRFEQWKKHFQETNLKLQNDKKISWSLDDRLENILDELNCVSNSMNREIDFAEEARAKGPALMERIPIIIGEAREVLINLQIALKEKKYLEGCLKKSEQQFQAIKDKYLDNLIDWPGIYAELKVIESDCEFVKKSKKTEKVKENKDGSNNDGYSASDIAIITGAVSAVIH